MHTIGIGIANIYRRLDAILFMDQLSTKIGEKRWLL